MRSPTDETRRGSRWSSPRTLALFLAGFVLLHAPSLWWGFFADDFGHRLVLENPTEHPTMRPWSLYDFGDPTSPKVRDDALFPWWTESDWRGRFFRPLTSVSLWLDHAVWGRWAPGHHLTNLALQLALLGTLLWLYRRVGLGAGVALLALALFALEDGSALVVGWIANRNSLLEALFAAAALGVALRAREKGGAHTTLALVLAGLATLCKESGVAVLAGCALLWFHPGAPGTTPARQSYYAYQGKGEEGKDPSRAGARRSQMRGASLVAAGLAATFLAFFVLAGYGVKSLFYPTPWGEPSLWLEHLGTMLVAGPASLLAPFPIDVLMAAPATFWPGMACAVLVLCLVGPAWVRAARATPYGFFLASFALFSLLPQASALPSDRLLFVPALALAPITATWLTTALAPDAGKWTRRIARTAALTALPLSGVFLVVRGLAFVHIAEISRRAVTTAELDARPPARRDALVLQAPSGIALLGSRAPWLYETGDRLTRIHALQLGQRALRWTRTDERTFELESLDEPFLTNLFESVFRTSSRAYQPGERLRTSAFEVELLECAAEGVRRFRVRCDEPLESERFVFLTWREERLRRLPVPALGESVVLERCQPLDPLLP